MLSTILALAALASSVAALPASARDSARLPTSDRITLVARTLPSSGPPANLTVDDYVVAAIHSGAGQSLASLSSNSSYATAFYANGSAAAFASLSAGLVTELTGPATPTNPAWGWDVTAINYAAPVGPSTGAICGVSAGGGAPGVHLSRDISGLVELRYRNASAPAEPQRRGAFLACQTVLYGTVVPSVNWRNASIATPEGCVDIELVPVCAPDFADGAPRPFLRKSACYRRASDAPVPAAAGA